MLYSQERSTRFAETENNIRKFWSREMDTADFLRIENRHECEHLKSKVKNK